MQRLAVPLKQLRRTQRCPEFTELMEHRLLMGFYRYEPIDSPNKGDYDLMGSLETRLANYRLTGNLEHLIDMGNMCLLEFMHSRHPLKHFKATDDGEHTQKGPTKYV